VVAEKTAKNFRGLLYFAAPCTGGQRESVADPTDDTYQGTTVISKMELKWSSIGPGLCLQKWSYVFQIDLRENSAHNIAMSF